MEWLVINMWSYAQSFGEFIYPPVPGVFHRFQASVSGPRQDRSQVGRRRWKGVGKAQSLPLSSVSMDDDRRSKRRLAETWKSRSEPSLAGLRSSSRALSPLVRS